MPSYRIAPRQVRDITPGSFHTAHCQINKSGRRRGFRTVLRICPDEYRDALIEEVSDCPIAVVVPGLGELYVMDHPLEKHFVPGSVRELNGG